MEEDSDLISASKSTDVGEGEKIISETGRILRGVSR
jgi:hypothetical protein